MREFKEARKITLFEIEGEEGVFKKVTALEAELYRDPAKHDKKPIQAVIGSSLAWFIPA